jgi:DNA-binding transcriptional regulator YdaS (Cro superfamily)
MNTTEIIQTLGGTFAVAKRCGVTPGAVSQWKHNGLPADKMVIIAAELEKQSDGRFTRKEIPNWHEIWPELEYIQMAFSKQRQTTDKGRVSPVQL